MISLANLIERYLDHLKVERNLSANTIESYGRDLRHLARALSEAGLDDPREVLADHLSTYLSSLARAKRAAASQRRALSSMRQLFLYGLRERLVATNPAKELESPQVPQLLPKVPSIAEAQRLFAALEEDETPRGLRDRAALELLYGAGMRASELCHLRLEDVDLRLGLVRLFGKGKKERQVPLGEPAVVALQLYLARARPSLVGRHKSPYLLLGRVGEQMSRMGVFNLVKRWAKRSGLDPSTSPHTLRHAFATHLVHGGADLRAVQEMLGHASIATTEIYTHVGQEALRQTVDRHHPLGRGQPLRPTSP